MMIIDDGETLLHALEPWLGAQSEVALVEAFADPLETLAHVREVPPEAALVNLEMPAISAGEAISRLRAIFPRIGIIAVSCRDAAVSRTVALEMGADEFVSGAAMHADLMPAIRRVVDKRRYRPNT